jgi:hypothetical protein
MMRGNNGIDEEEGSRLDGPDSISINGPSIRSLMTERISNDENLGNMLNNPCALWKNKAIAVMEDGRMQPNVLVRTLGDTHFLKVLGFFLEHPFHAFNISQISRYLDISRDTVKKDLDFFEFLGYIVRTRERGPYRLKRSDEMVQTLLRCLDDITRTLEEEGAREPLDRPYLNDIHRRAPTSIITSVGGA